MKNPTIALIISTHQSADVLNRVLYGVTEQTQLPDEIIVTEDGQDPQTARTISDWQKNGLEQLLHIAKPSIQDTNKQHIFNKTHTLNSAIAHASADYLIFLDGDCIPHHKLIEDHTTAAKPGTFIQSKRSCIRQSRVHQLLTHKKNITQMIATGGVTEGIRGLFKSIRWPLSFCRHIQASKEILGLGANCGFWRNDLIKINGYDEDYIGWGHEDTDLKYRLCHAGLIRKLIYSRAIVYHLNHPPRPRCYSETNFQRLQNTIENKIIRCKRGLAEHLTTISDN